MEEWCLENFAPENFCTALNNTTGERWCDHDYFCPVTHGRCWRRGDGTRWVWWLESRWPTPPFLNGAGLLNFRKKRRECSQRFVDRSILSRHEKSVDCSVHSSESYSHSTFESHTSHRRTSVALSPLFTLERTGRILLVDPMCYMHYERRRENNCSLIMTWNAIKNVYPWLNPLIFTPDNTSEDDRNELIIIRCIYRSSESLFLPHNQCQYCEEKNPSAALIT